jgi:hypothetical protein
MADDVSENKSCAFSCYNCCDTLFESSDRSDLSGKRLEAGVCKWVCENKLFTYAINSVKPL